MPTPETATPTPVPTPQGGTSTPVPTPYEGVITFKTTRNGAETVETTTSDKEQQVSSGNFFTCDCLILGASTLVIYLASAW